MGKTFKNQHVVLTGGLGDIGRAICEAFAREGASVSLCDIREPTEATDLLLLLREKYQVNCRYDKVNVGVAAEVERWIDEITDCYGTPTIVVANAAVVSPRSILEIKPEQWESEISINLNGVFYTVQTAARKMIKFGRGGRIVLIGSWAAHKVHLKMPAYSVAKAAVRMLCQCLALELASTNILVNEVAPGYVMAGLSRKVLNGSSSLHDEAEARIPIGRFIQVESVAAQVLYLCHPDNQHMTGTTLLMDGGLSLL